MLEKRTKLAKLQRSNIYRLSYGNGISNLFKNLLKWVYNPRLPKLTIQLSHSDISLSYVRLISFSRVICYQINKAIYFTWIFLTKMAMGSARNLRDALGDCPSLLADRKSQLATWMYFSTQYCTSWNKHSFLSALFFFLMLLCYLRVWGLPVGLKVGWVGW